MESIDKAKIEAKAAEFLQQQVYIHLEVNPGAYWRNGAARLQALHIKGDEPYRLFLELAGTSAQEADEGGLIQVNDLTHMELGPNLLIFSGYDDKGRIAQTLEISLSPFSL